MTADTISLRARLLRPLVHRMLWPALNGPGTAQQRRARVERVARRTQLWLPRGTRIQESAVDGVPCEWVDNPRGAERGVMLYLHGGAYVLGSPRAYRDLTSRLALRCHLRVCALDYRLAPEHPFPAAVDDAVAAYRAILDSGVPAARVVIAGDSAGGGLALACALKLKSTPMPQPAGLVLFSPWADLSLSGESLRMQARHDLVLSRDFLAQSAADYLGGESARNTLASPLFADFTGVAPMLVQVTENEILYDDATHLVANARHYGVQASLQRASQLWHVWQLMAGKMPEADQALEQVAGFVLSRIGAAAPGQGGVA